MCIEFHNKYVEARKDLVRKYITKEEMQKMLTNILNDYNIKFKNEESKAISKKNLFALKLSLVNESKVRKTLYSQIKEMIKEEIEDIDRILDSFLILYLGTNKINYLYINY